MCSLPSLLTEFLTLPCVTEFLTLPSVPTCICPCCCHTPFCPCFMGDGICSLAYLLAPLALPPAGKPPSGWTIAPCLPPPALPISSASFPALTRLHSEPQLLDHKCQHSKQKPGFAPFPLPSPLQEYQSLPFSHPPFVAAYPTHSAFPSLPCSSLINSLLSPYKIPAPLRQVQNPCPCFPSLQVPLPLMLDALRTSRAARHIAACGGARTQAQVGKQLGRGEAGPGGSGYAGEEGGWLHLEAVRMERQPLRQWRWRWGGAISHILI